MTRQLLLATRNPGKVAEYRSLLEGAPYELTTLEGEGIRLEVAESGRSFEENAILKAQEYAKASGLFALADDSGLEVVALGGEPGPLSARYGGEGLTDEQRVAYLLNQLAGIPWGRRQARFVCVIALAQPDGQAQLVRGECEGNIALEPKGSNGFGYDPIFYYPPYRKTLAEVSPSEKEAVSHRGKAARAAKELLHELASMGDA